MKFKVTKGAIGQTIRVCGRYTIETRETGRRSYCAPAREFLPAFDGAAITGFRHSLREAIQECEQHQRRAHSN